MALICAFGSPRVIAAQSDFESAPDELAANADDLGFGTEPAGAAVQSQLQAGGSGDDLGFGTAASFDTPAASATVEGPSRFQLRATLRMQGAVRTETKVPSRFAKGRQVLDAWLEYKDTLGETTARIRALATLHTEADFAHLSELDTYDSVTIRSEAWQVRPGETYLSLAWSVLEISYGYQIANLGQGELLSVLDVVNPRDLREPLPTDLNVSHLPVLMLKASVAVGKLNLEAVVVQEPYFGLIPPPLGEFSPFRRLLLDDPSFGSGLAGRTLRNRHVPNLNLGDVGAIQPYGRIRWSVGGLDVSLLVGSPLNALGVPGLPEPSAFSSPVIDMPVVHSRYELFGHGGSYAAGPLLLRWELAFNRKRPASVQATDSTLLRLSGIRSDAVQGMLGLTYFASTLTSAALEFSKTYLFDNPNRNPIALQKTLFPIEAPQLALRFNHRFLGERARLSLLLFVLGVNPVNAWAGRAELAYAITDRVEVSAGYVTYQPTGRFGFFYGLDQHDRAFLNLRWEIAD